MSLTITLSNEIAAGAVVLSSACSSTAEESNEAESKSSGSCCALGVSRMLEIAVETNDCVEIFVSLALITLRGLDQGAKAGRTIGYKLVILLKLELRWVTTTAAFGGLV